MKGSGVEWGGVNEMNRDLSNGMNMITKLKRDREREEREKERERENRERDR